MTSPLKRILAPLASTPLHPQWLVRRARAQLVAYLPTIEPDSLVIDIGCFDRWPVRHLPASCRYIGLDYLETAENWYGTKPDVYGDAAALPFADGSADVVMMFSVLEHLAEPERVLADIRRLLRPAGRLVMQVPFLYPLHDRPRDFGRFTEYGLRRTASATGFELIECEPIGGPLETSALLANIAMSRAVLDWAAQRNPLALLGAGLPVAVVGTNLLSRALTSLGRASDMMPFAYHVVLVAG